MRPRNNDIFNVSHPTRLVFLIRLRVALSHFTKNKFKYSFLDMLNPICIFSFYIETLNHLFFSIFQDSLRKEKTFHLGLKGSYPTFLKNLTPVLQQYFSVAIQAFQLNLTSKYSIHLLTTYYLQRCLKLVSFIELHS